MSQFSPEGTLHCRKDVGGNELMRSLKNAITKKAIARGYERHPNLADYLPWRDFNAKHNLFLLQDNQTLAMGFNLTPIPCEARPDEMLTSLVNSVRKALQNAIPLEKDEPWVVQFYVSKNHSLKSLQ